MYQFRTLQALFTALNHVRDLIQITDADFQIQVIISVAYFHATSAFGNISDTSSFLRILCLI